MSTIMNDVAATTRLSRQFENAVRKGNPGDAVIEARRFVSFLCDRLERNNHALMAAARNKRPEHVFNAAMASRQGENVALTCSFLLNDLAARVGRARIAEYLTATGTRSGRALAKRVGSRPQGDTRVAAIRFSATDARPRQCATQSAPFAGTTAVTADYRFRGAYPGALKPGLVIENEGYRTSHFVAAQVRLYARFGDREPWVATAGNAFAFLERVGPQEAHVLALRGFDCMDLIRQVDSRNRDPLALRLMAHLL